MIIFYIEIKYRKNVKKNIKRIQYFINIYFIIITSIL